MTLTRLIARPLLASVFVAESINALRDTEARAVKAKPVADKLLPLAEKAVPGLSIPSDPTTLVRINAAAQLVAAGALATGRVPRLSAAVLAASLVPTTLAGHPFWNETDPQVKARQRLGFIKNASILGGLLLAGVDTEGQPGLAWRARRAARDVRRETRRLAKDAGREARLAKAKVS